MQLTIDLNESEYNKLRKLTNGEITVENLAKKIILGKVNNVHLEGNFKYNPESKQLLDEKNHLIKLTKKEFNLFNYLLEHALTDNSKYIEIDDIKKDVWKDETTTIFSIRNKIFAIREKTCREIIISKNNHGYKLNIKESFENF